MNLKALKLPLLFIATLTLVIGCKPQADHQRQKEDVVYSISPDFTEIEDAYSFYAFGDWGRNGQYGQKELAEMMNKAAAVVEPEFIVTVGDNFYPNGVASTADHQWISSFESVYSGHNLYCNWYAVLGNHDYRGNAQAQIDYTYVSRRWNMPARYYTFDKEADDGAKMTFLFIDTSPFELKYYEEEKYKYAISKQDTAKQIAWIDSVLSKSDADWKIVVGHHPLYSGGKRIKTTEDVRKQLEPILKRNGVDLYLAGHEHDLQHIKPEGPTHHIVSGAGSEIRPTGMTDHSLFAKSIQGFAEVSVTKPVMHIRMVDYQGNVIYTTKIEKP